MTINLQQADCKRCVRDMDSTSSVVNCHGNREKGRMEKKDEATCVTETHIGPHLSVDLFWCISSKGKKKLARPQFRQMIKESKWMKEYISNPLNFDNEKWVAFLKHDSLVIGYAKGTLIGRPSQFPLFSR